MLDRLPKHKYTRALEVACSQGLLTKDLLSKKYGEVVMFDKCHIAREEADDNNIDNKNVLVEKPCSMQDYKFGPYRSYTGIYMRWCLGYLNRDEQIDFLQRAQKALANEPGRYSRTNPPPSYIFVLDNIDYDKNRKEPLKIKG